MYFCSTGGAFFFLLLTVSVYFVASTGETFEAILPGREQDSKTVISANRADAKKINGEVLTVETPAPKVVRAITTGVRVAPTPYPNNNPAGMPTMHKTVPAGG